MLEDGTYTYLYGNVRIAQETGTTTEYFLTKFILSVRRRTLGSVRQLVDENGTLTLTQSYRPYGETLDVSGNGTSNYAFAGEWREGNGLDYLRARYYAPGQGRFITKDAWAGDAMRPMSYNGWVYAYANPVNYVDPTGFIGCQKFNEDISLGYFSYQKRSCTSGTGLLVNYRSSPWNQYASPSAPGGTVRVPLRHELDLDPGHSCITATQAQAFYASGRFEDWEVNARNILGEIGAVIGTSAEWALRDAIGIGYIPYNRVGIYAPYDNGNISAVRGLILAGSQFAILHGDSFNRTIHGYNLGKDAQTIHEITLIIAYGVEKRYFMDTSFGAVSFAHRLPNEPEWKWEKNNITGEYDWFPKGNHTGIACGQTGPAFFQHYSDVNTYPTNLTSAQLVDQGGWGSGLADNSYLPSICNQNFTQPEAKPDYPGTKPGCIKRKGENMICP